MKKRELQALRKKSAEELEKELLGLKKKASKARVDIYAGQEKNLKKARLLRKDIAQYMAVIKEKTRPEREEGVEG